MDLPRLVPCCLTHVLPVHWWNDGPGVVDQSVPTTYLFNALLNSVSDILTNGEGRLKCHGLDALVRHRINRLTYSICGVEVVHRSVRALLAQNHHDFLADSAT